MIFILVPIGLLLWILLVTGVLIAVANFLSIPVELIWSSIPLVKQQKLISLYKKYSKYDWLYKLLIFLVFVLLLIWCTAQHKW